MLKLRHQLARSSTARMSTPAESLPSISCIFKHRMACNLIERDLIKTDPTITILAMTEDERVVMSSEYRAGVNGGDSVSLPAGIITLVKPASRQPHVNYVRKRLCCQPVTKMTCITFSVSADQFGRPDATGI